MKDGDTTARVHFLLGLFIGDNLGLSAMLGMVESFSAMFFVDFVNHPKLLPKLCLLKIKTLFEL